jgi:hypothetical protein
VEREGTKKEESGNGIGREPTAVVDKFHGLP